MRKLNSPYLNQCIDISKDNIFSPSKVLFKVHCHLRSSLYTNDPYLAKFLYDCKLPSDITKTQKTHESVNEAYSKCIRCGPLRMQGKNYLIEKVKFVGTPDKFATLQLTENSKLQIVFSKCIDLSDPEIFEISGSHRIEVIQNQKANEKVNYSFIITKSETEDFSNSRMSLIDLSKDIMGGNMREFADGNHVRLIVDEEDEMYSWIQTIYSMKIINWDQFQSILGIRFAPFNVVSQFLPVIMRQLFYIITTKTEEEDREILLLRESALISMFHVFDIISKDEDMETRSVLLDSYVIQVFDEFQNNKYSKNPFLAFEAITEL